MLKLSAPDLVECENKYSDSLVSTNYLSTIIKVIVLVCVCVLVLFLSLSSSSELGFVPG